MRLAALGKRDREAGDAHMTEREKWLARRQAFSILAKSIVIGIVGAVAVYFLPWPVG